jgi:hypothetical protein
MSIDKRLSSGAGGYARGRREDSTTRLTEEMQKQTTDEYCGILNELYVQGRTYQLSQQRQTNSVPSITHNSRKCRVVKRGKGQAEETRSLSILKNHAQQQISSEQ